MNEAKKKPAPDRGKKGGRVKVRTVRFSPEEDAAIEEKARNSALSFGAFLRASALGNPGPRARRSPPLNAELLAYAIAQLNRAGNNLNQLNRILNAARAAGSQDSAEAIRETRAAVRMICESLGRQKRNDSQGQDA